MRDGIGQRRGWILSSPSKLNNRQERNRGKHHVDEVNIVLLWHEALAEAVRVGPEAAQEEGWVLYFHRLPSLTIDRRGTAANIM
jgi:hypothetical protein